MISIFKDLENKIISIPQPVNGCWINVIDPTPDEIAQLQELGIATDYINYPLDMDERPWTERENGELFILLRIPYFKGFAEDIPYITIPLGIILTDNLIITVCKLKNDILQELESGRLRGLETAKRLRFVLRLLLLNAQHYLNYLRLINKELDYLEDQLQMSTRNKEVLEILKYQKSLTLFTTALRANELVLERLERMQLFKAFPEDEDLLDDVITENRQAIEMTNISISILSNLMDAFASIISNNLNAVMKFLASVTIVLSLPTMVASFYGMNVRLPFESLDSAFLLVLGFSLLISGIVVFIFWKKDWF